MLVPRSECQPPGERDVGPLLVRKLDEVLVRQQRLDVSCGLYIMDYIWLICAQSMDNLWIWLKKAGDLMRILQ